MTREQIEKVADEYASEYATMYQKIAKMSYIDGMIHAFEYMKEKMSNL